MNNSDISRGRYSGPFTGSFRLRRPFQRKTRDGRAYVQMVLEDMNGSMPAYMWRLQKETAIPADLTCVQVNGRIRWRRDGAVADVVQVGKTEKVAEDVIHLVPRSICPLPWLLPFLQTIIGRINSPSLRHFIMDVLSNDSIAFPFVSCPASLRFHHNYPGGLLRHSIECVQMVERYREFPQEKKELAIAGALFHDIGKILTMTPQMKRTTLGAALDHDKLTLEVLAPYLRRLHEKWSTGAAELRYLMTWRPGKRDRGIPRTPLANVLLAADRVSAGIDRRPESP